uniref:tRNA (guanine-N(7)-)-methyltransferase n=1 Tax=Albugo laibachii Nc14 TaxID=890382 RepID=F0WH75_9STRA|nr:tRNA (guanineN(7))methyltransferase putative [Albugo laibachii Nc14]|eukprot:CCA20590.1 tRNA (guanineN(7))methyltransferase putative [Albugo laibachii Nc14]
MMDWSNFYQLPKKVEILDIGCGFGGLTVTLAKLFPNQITLALEIRPKVTEFVRLRIEALRAAHVNEYQNVAVMRSNAMRYLPHFFEKAQIQKMFFCFPDPQFKQRNHRRRIVSSDLLTEYAYCLAPGGILYTITDVKELYEWHVQKCTDHPCFQRLSEEELAMDPCVRAMTEETEEGKKVSRTGGSKYVAVFRRIPDSKIPEAHIVISLLSARIQLSRLAMAENGTVSTTHSSQLSVEAHAEASNASRNEKTVQEENQECDHVVEISAGDTAVNIRSDSNDLDSVAIIRENAHLAGYPADCGTSTYKYLSYAKVLRDRGLTHPMRYSSVHLDAVGNPRPELHPISTDFGAHAFHNLPTDSLVLSHYGIGLTLYFKFLKVMSWLFFLLVIITLPMLAIYVSGSESPWEEFKVLYKQNVPSVMRMTSIGHLKESSSTCDQGVQGETISLSCAAGEIGFIKAVYSELATQGSCTCPERNKVMTKTGECRAQYKEECTSHSRCTKRCSSSDYGCFLGVHPVSKVSCCADAWDSASNAPNFSALTIKTLAGCVSKSAQSIAEGLCFGKSTCSFVIDEDATYTWTKLESQKSCPRNKTLKELGTICMTNINDSSDYSACPDPSTRGLLVFAQCFTTSINLFNEWSFKIVGWSAISRNQYLGFAVGCDIVCSFLFLAIVLWMKRKEAAAIDRISRNQIVAADYTVQLMHLPKHTDLDQLRDELRAHLERILTAAEPCTRKFDHIRIADIQFGKSTSGQLKLLRDRGVSVRKLEVEIQRLEKIKQLEGKLDPKKYNSSILSHIKKSRKLDTTLQKHNVKLEKWRKRHGEGTRAQAVTAFITFEEEEGFYRCLQVYPDLGALHRFFQPMERRLHGKRLRFCPAPDPSDIKWENLHYSGLERFFRRWIVNLCALSFLLLSFVIIFLAKYEKGQLDLEFGRTTSCPATITKDDVVLDEFNKQTAASVYKALVGCYCESLLHQMSFQEMMNEEFDVNALTGGTQRYCKVWAKSFVTAQSLSVASIMMVVLVNLLLTRILKFLVKMEKYHTESGHIISQVIKIFFAQLCNTALLVIIINANVQSFYPANSVTSINVSSFQLLSGKYGDFSTEWYQDVGVSLMLTMIINILSPHLNVFVTYLRLEIERFWDRGCTFDYSKTKQDTQRDLEALYRGPKFDLAQRYAQILTTIFITYLLSAGMPLLHVIGFCGIFITYWADKFTFLRITRSPPLYDEKIAKMTGSLLPYAVLLHCCVALWMFSNSMIFQNQEDIQVELHSPSIEFIGEGIPSFQPIERQNLFRRVTRKQVVVLFGFFASACALIVMRILLEYIPALFQNLCPMLKKNLTKTKAVKDLPNYFDAIPTIILREKLQSKRLRRELQQKFQQALDKRMASRLHSKVDLQKRRKTMSGAEQYREENWIVGCHSYSIIDNKEYIHDLAIDSPFSDDIQLDRIL